MHTIRTYNQQRQTGDKQHKTKQQNNNPACQQLAFTPLSSARRTPTRKYSTRSKASHTHSAFHKKYSTQSDTRAAKARAGRAKFFIFLSSQSESPTHAPDPPMF
jgi:hypothetical protein